MGVKAIVLTADEEITEESIESKYCIAQNHNETQNVS